MALAELPSANDLTLLRVEQARLLKERVLGSCLLVEFIVAYTAVIMGVVGQVATGLAWFAAATAMVLVTYAYGRLAARDGIDTGNVFRFLRWHCVVSALTGLVWGGFAIYQLDYASEATLFIGSLTVCSITLGGVIPSSAYRATYVCLASASLPPFGLYVLATAPDPLRLVGLGVLVFYFFAMFVSARVEIDTRETIASRNARMLNERIVAQNQLYLKASEEKSRFLAATSHDLSQPLQSQGFFIRALRDAVDAPDQARLLDRIEESWRAQRELLQGIVDVSRIDSGAIVPRMTPFRLKQECEKLVAEYAARGNACTIEGAFDEVEMVTDPVLLMRVVRNLLSNALKFTPPDGRILFSARRHGERVRIVVEDTGPGIPENEQARIFEEYVQLRQADGRTARGLGLGLSIVLRLCKLLNIDLDFRSREGEGTRFGLEMARAGEAAPAPEASGRSIDTFADAPLVVLVDDDRSVLDAMEFVLTSWNCRILSASSSRQALELLALTDSCPDLMLVDKRLGPDDDGGDLIEAIREECNERIPAIVISGNLGRLSGFEESEATIGLNKPIDPTDLRVAMQDMLRTSRA